jgi:starch synthase
VGVFVAYQNQFLYLSGLFWLPAEDREGMRILYVASEAVPFAKTGGLADVVGALPKYILELGHEAVVVLPRYRGVKTLKVLLPSLTIPLGGDLKFCSIHESEPSGGVRFFLVDYPDYYNRQEFYRENNQDYVDNAERFALFSLAALEFAKRAPLPPDVIHCNDWQTAPIPVYLKTLYRNDQFFEHAKTLLTIHNLAFQGVFHRSMLGRIGMPAELFNPEQLEFYGSINLLKGGIVFADKLSTVSEKYSQEIRTPEFGCGLEGVLQKRSIDLVGILNGVDYSEWNPETDPWLVSTYSSDDLSGKSQCKVDLLKQFGIQNSRERPLIGIISRMADQKGFDLLYAVADIMVQEGFSMVVLGTGEERYTHFFLSLQAKYPAYVGARIAYDEWLAHKIEGGADLFLMPSRFEPCGLNQIYSLKYGTVPVVRATGGLDDTIQDFSDTPDGTGFKFQRYVPEELLGATRRALEVYRTPQRWTQLVRNGMRRDFSWHRSAQRYLELYRGLVST